MMKDPLAELPGRLRSALNASDVRRRLNGRQQVEAASIIENVAQSVHRGVRVRSATASPTGFTVCWYHLAGADLGTPDAIEIKL